MARNSNKQAHDIYEALYRNHPRVSETLEPAFDEVDTRILFTGLDVPCEARHDD